MEYCKHLDLGTHLDKHEELSEEHTRSIILQVLRGLSMMHENDIAHRDLKPAVSLRVVNSRLVRLLMCNAQNILIQELPQPWAEDEKWWVVLGDLGLSRRNEDATGKTTIVGTRQFMAPETIGKPFSGDPTTADPKSADMWCLGETVSYVLTKCPTFPDTEELVQYQQREAEFPDDGLKRKGYSEEVIDFVRSLMKADPPQRFTVSQALEHSWITRMPDRKSVALNTGHYASSTDNLVSGSGTLLENAQIPATPTPPLRAPSATDSNAAKKADFVAQFQEKLRLQDEAEKKAKEASKEASKQDTKSTAKVEKTDATHAHWSPRVGDDEEVRYSHICCPLHRLTLAGI
jgi:serine/threonine protein kinase